MIDETKRHPRGGLYFEDFIVGDTMPHRLTRTVTQMDNMLFSNMTLNPQPLHIDAHFCATETEWGKPLMNSLFTLGLMIGISVNDTTRRHHHRQSRHDRRDVSQSAFRRRHDQRRRRKSSRSANRNRAPMRASSISSIAPTSRTARWWRNAEGRPSCASVPQPMRASRDALAPVRSRRQPAQAREGADIRRRRASHRSRRFSRTRREG